MQDFRTYVASRLSGYRLEHSYETEKTARLMAEKFGADPEKAALAGLLHDIARDMTPAQLLREAHRKGIMVREVDRFRPVLLHGKVAAAIARDELRIEDAEVLQAISSHVAGRKGWTILEKILYLADKIEPTRDYPEVHEIRAILDRGDFHKALRKALENAVAFAKESESGVVDPETVVVLGEESEAASSERCSRDRRD